LLDNSFALITDYNVSEDSSLIQGSLPDLDFDDTTRVHYESLSRNYADANLNFAATYLYAVDGARADLIAIY
jgi:hypothetical protein